ncbi:pyruvate kinase [Marinigracilibium pacificum]|uniref:Pyruvate kinase n=1 Tax=Marinigracilibium pacificum TaxID=2729599 RepID=A0A848J0U8_9BACT|nr:pyruvate kinase [Marinigracilibium pacificum]NMM49145.1 pyruvate kinase [Marinigracilibium pacificum]
MSKEINFNKTKIIATVGPASNNKDMLRKLIRAGADVFRLNFSHGTHEDHKKVIDFVRELNEELGTHVALLQDLQGPKIRTQEVENGEVIIKEGDKLTITTEDVVGNAERIGTTYKDIVNDVKEGEMILIDDGKIELKVLSTSPTEVVTEIVYGGPLKSRKGINLPQSEVSAPSLTEKDIRDLEFGLEQDVDWIALSFVRKADDVRDIKKRISDAGRSARVIAKIEKPQAVDNIDEIIEVTDAIMVARGDLGVEVVMEEVPTIQKDIVRKCNLIGRPVIIATQMMESMIENPRPTRAETNDIANAVMDGADTLMLSAESAAGKYPVESVTSMAKTISIVESRTESIYFHHTSFVRDESPTFVSDNLVLVACRLAKRTEAKAIFGITNSGYTGIRASCHRPKAHIFIFTSNKKLLNVLSLVWGVRGIYYDGGPTTDETFEDQKKIIEKMGYVKKGDLIVQMASMPLEEKKRTNTLKIDMI